MRASFPAPVSGRRASSRPAVAVGNPGGVRCEERHQALDVSGLGGQQELFGDPGALLGVKGIESFAPCVHVLAGSMRDLSHRRG